mmetsp:Transcript_58596/g.126792  ORF Transcript_58596/g.126792 Transcript_58596/m.126792 type:complete len:371 (-) Transcript_58596:50-1162(-)
MVISWEFFDATSKEVHEKDIRSGLLPTCIFILTALVSFWLAYGCAARRQIHSQGMKLVLLIVSFGCASWGMNVLNKALIEIYVAPNLASGAQMLMTVGATLMFGSSSLTYNSPQLLRWLPVPLFFFGMLTSSFLTYEYVSLSTIVVLRNLSPLVTLAVEVFVMPADKRPEATKTMIAALSLLVVGAFVYAGGISISLVGIFAALLNMFLAISDRLIQRRLLTVECKDLSASTCVLLNNGVGFLPCMLLGFCTGELAEYDRKTWLSASSILLLLMSGLAGCGLSYFGIAVQREISATSFMVLQNVVRAAVVVAGVAFFGDPIKRVSTAIGLAICFAGAMLYGHTQAAAATSKTCDGASANADPEQQPLVQK